MVSKAVKIYLWIFAGGIIFSFIYSHVPALKTALHYILDPTVGVLLNSEDAFLLASRPEGKAYAGYWEFPGGKYEDGEMGKEALARELQEELGIDIDLTQTFEWRVQTVDYPHALVELNFFQIRGFKGELQTLEGQAMTWSKLPVTVSPVLPGALPVLEWLAVDRAFSGPTHFVD